LTNFSEIINGLDLIEFNVLKMFRILNNYEVRVSFMHALLYYAIYRLLYWEL